MSQRKMTDPTNDLNTLTGEINPGPGVENTE
jgi:hypothetical protein